MVFGLAKTTPLLPVDEAIKLIGEFTEVEVILFVTPAASEILPVKL